MSLCVYLHLYEDLLSLSLLYEILFAAELFNSHSVIADLQDSYGSDVFVLQRKQFEPVCGME